MEMNKSIMLNYLIDLTKKDINKFERASLIREYLQETRMSIRALAKQINIPKSTIEDWLLYNHMNEEEYKKCLDSGLTITQIYSTLRKNKGEKTINKTNIMDKQLEEISTNLNRIFHLASDEKRTPETIEIIRKIKNITNRIEMRLEQNDKRKNI